MDSTSYKSTRDCFGVPTGRVVGPGNLTLEKHIIDLMEHISKHPNIYPSTGKHSNLRKGLIDKNNYIVYRIRPRKRIIEIINFRGTKQKPLSP